MVNLALGLLAVSLLYLPVAYGIEVVIPDVGIVRGHPIQIEPSIVSFVGIRYAAAPEGDRRWRAPQRAHWNQIFDATERIACVQRPSMLLPPHISQTEDCLRINIWANSSAINGRPSERCAAVHCGEQFLRFSSLLIHFVHRLPVLVYIHGGSFEAGSGLDGYIDPVAFAGPNRFVLVTLNYRLGVLGFLAHPHLSATSPTAPTNFGLLDQRFALEWIQRNIQYFGGDSSRVTISGESAGGSSVWAHIAAPTTPLLFSRAYIMSAVPQMTALTLPQAMDAGRKRAALAGCALPGNDFADLEREISCLRTIDAESLQGSSKRDLFFHAYPLFPARPVLDDGVNFDLRTSVSERREGFADVDIVMGSVLDEGTFFTFLPFIAVPPSTNFFRRLIHNAFDPLGVEGLSERISEVYSPEKYESKRTHASAAMQALSEALGDLSFTCGTQHLLSAIAKHRSLNPQASTKKLYGYAWAMEGFADVRVAALANNHGSDLNFFFGVSTDKISAGNLKSMSPDEKLLGAQYRENVASFIRTGNPSSKRLPWVEYHAKTELVTVILSANKSSHEKFKEDKCKFWADVFPTLTAPMIVIDDPFAGEELLSAIANPLVSVVLSTLMKRTTEAVAAALGLLLICGALWRNRCFSKKVQRSSTAAGKKPKAE